MSYDCFISYSSEDLDLVHPLFKEMEMRGWMVWFDSISLRAGDDAWRAISEGLKEAELVVMVIGPSFMRKPWPRRELEVAIAREATESRRLLVPVLHGVTYTELAEYSPLLADRVSVDASGGVAAIVDQLQRVRELSLDNLDEGRLAHLLGPDGRPLRPDDPVRRAFDLSVASFNDQVVAHLAANPRLLYELTPRRFEELVAEIYSRSGFEVELTPASGDGGADVFAVRRDDLGSTLIVVQAKRYKPELKVEASAVRELLGTVDLNRASAGVLITTSSFRSGAEELAEQLKWRLSLKDYARLQDLLKTSSRVDAKAG